MTREVAHQLSFEKGAVFDSATSRRVSTAGRRQYTDVCYNMSQATIREASWNGDEGCMSQNRCLLVIAAVSWRRVESTARASRNALLKAMAEERNPDPTVDHSHWRRTKHGEPKKTSEFRQVNPCVMSLLTRGGLFVTTSRD